MAGIAESTLRGYMQDSEFVDRYKQAFGDMVRDATRQAQQTLSPALSTLREIMEDKGEQAQARISAARSVLEYSLKLCEQTDILEQLRGRTGDVVVFPDCMLRSEGDCFLDDKTPEQLAQELGVPVEAVPTGGEALVRVLLR